MPAILLILLVLSQCNRWISSTAGGSYTMLQKQQTIIQNQLVSFKTTVTTIKDDITTAYSVIVRRRILSIKRRDFKLQLHDQCDHTSKSTKHLTFEIAYETQEINLIEHLWGQLMKTVEGSFGEILYTVFPHDLILTQTTFF